MEQGKGTFVQSGKTKKFVPNLHSEKVSTVTTDDETLDIQKESSVDNNRSVVSTLANKEELEDIKCPSHWTKRSAYPAEENHSTNPPTQKPHPTRTANQRSWKNFDSP